MLGYTYYAILYYNLLDYISDSARTLALQDARTTMPGVLGRRRDGLRWRDPTARAGESESFWLSTAVRHV